MPACSCGLGDVLAIGGKILAARKAAFTAPLKARIAELEADKQRLDWLEAQQTVYLLTMRESECTGDVKVVETLTTSTNAKRLRTAIDIAMKHKQPGRAVIS